MKVSYIFWDNVLLNVLCTPGQRQTWFMTQRHAWTLGDKNLDNPVIAPVLEKKPHDVICFEPARVHCAAQTPQEGASDLVFNLASTEWTNSPVAVFKTKYISFGINSAWFWTWMAWDAANSLIQTDLALIQIFDQSKNRGKNITLNL